MRNMKTRVIVGTLLAHGYNACIGRCPSRRLRGLYLRHWLKEAGNGIAVQMGCRFLNARRIAIGDRTVLNFGTLLDGRVYGIQIGSDVSIGPEAAVLSLGHDPQSSEFCDKGGDVFIGDRAWIGYRAIILPGVKIGEGAVVGAGSVVSKDVNPFTIVVGNPAKPIGERNRDLIYNLHFSPWLM
jgi:maltose O-acetyltransferase